MPDEPDEVQQETRRGNAGNAQKKSEAAAAAEAEEFVPPEALDERQAAIGTHRKPAGPEPPEEAEAAAMPVAPPDVEKTECGEPPEE